MYSMHVYIASGSYIIICRVIENAENIFTKSGYLEKMLFDISWWIRQLSAPGGFSGPSYGRFTFSEKDKWGWDKSCVRKFCFQA